MKRLWVRLSLAFAVVIATGVLMIAAVGLVISRNDRVGDFFLDRFVLPPEMMQELLRYYSMNGSWEGVNELLTLLNEFLPRAPGSRLVLVLAEPDGRVISSRAGADPTGPPAPEIPERLTADQLERAIAILWNRQVVGYVLLNRVNLRLPDNPIAETFLQRQIGSTLLIVAGVMGVVSLAAGVLVSRSLTAPLAQLAQTAQGFGAGSMEQRADLRGSAEIVEVAAAFNEMASALQRADQQRRLLVADIAHELRTPLTVLKSNLQAMQDGVYALDTVEIDRLLNQTELLARLVNDLHLLAQAEANQLQLNRDLLDLGALALKTVQSFQAIASDHNLTLRVEAVPGAAIVDADANRLEQVLHNLLDNALTHTPSGGTIAVRQEVAGGRVSISVQDTGSGIPPEHLPHVFERFYRADPSRSRATGGAGLGLAIVKALVEMHGGSVAAHSDNLPGCGATLTLTLPLADIVESAAAP